MRGKLISTVLFGVAGLFALVISCSDDANGPGAGAGAGAGAAGEGASSPGSAGTTPLGGAGGSGTGGAPSGAGGDPSGSGAVPSGSGGDAAGAGSEASGAGGSASTGGETSGAAGGGSPACTAVTLGDVEYDGSGVYTATFTPNLLTADGDAFHLVFHGSPYDGGTTGTFDLADDGDDNLKTCARCAVIEADIHGLLAQFFQSEGTLIVDASSSQLDGQLEASFSGLKLVEVTVGQDFTSTPVPNGACLSVADANILVAPAYPDGWICPPEFYGDLSCDCGCGALDSDCPDTTSLGECLYCNECTAVGVSCNTDLVDPADTTMCK